jgi:uncharacterized protein (TIGR00369 family)
MSELHYGVAVTPEAATLSGRELLQAIIDGRLPHPPISSTLTFWLVEVGDGFAAFEGDPGTQMINPMGGVHGGWALTLIDSAAACAGHSLLGAGSAYTTVETHGALTRAITLATGRVRAEGRVVNAGRQIITSEVRVTDAKGRLLAHGGSTLLVLAPR